MKRAKCIRAPTPRHFVLLWMKRRRNQCDAANGLMRVIAPTIHFFRRIQTFRAGAFFHDKPAHT
jgi:hypothetical protein